MQVFIAGCYGKLWYKVEYIQFKNSVEKSEVVRMFVILYSRYCCCEELCIFSHFTVYLFFCLFLLLSLSLSIFDFFFLVLDNKISELTKKKKSKVKDEQIFSHSEHFSYCELECVSLNKHNSLSKYDGSQIQNKSDFIYSVYRYGSFVVQVVIADDLLICDILLQLGSGQCKNIDGSMVQVFFSFCNFFPLNFPQFYSAVFSSVFFSAVSLFREQS